MDIKALNHYILDYRGWVMFKGMANSGVVIHII